MQETYEDQMFIDGLEYCNWNRDILEDLWKGGVTAIHATLVYWENTEESFKKIEEWNKIFKNNEDIITHAKSSNDILEAKKNSSGSF